MSIEAMKQALEALETPRPLDDYPPILKAYAKTINEAITSLRQAIAEAEKQEPVATLVNHHGYTHGIVRFYNVENIEELPMPMGTNFYTHPQPKREWVGLTQTEVVDLLCDYNKLEGHIGWQKLIYMTEAKLKEKNT